MEIKKEYILLLLLSFFLTSCNSVDKKNIQIIEGIQLGTNFNQYERQIDSIGIESKQFFTKLFIDRVNEIASNSINVHVSDMFNLSNFRYNTNHYAILYPTTRSGTDNVIGLTAILGHTTNSMMLTSSGFINLTKEYNIENFNQNISTDLVVEIKKMISSKYGQPSLDRVKSEYNTFYVLERNTIKEYSGDGEIKGAKTTWENDFLEIELFEGVPSYTAVINKNGYQVSEPFFNSQMPKILIPDLSKGEKQCVSYAYIKYELKPEIIEKLKLNDKKL